MKMTEALIQRFINKECSEQEKDAVRQYLAQHPEELERLLTENSWREFETGETVPDEVSSRMLQAIRAQVRTVQQVRMKWAAAAAVAAACGIALWIWQSDSDKRIPAGMAAATVPVHRSMQPAFHDTINRTNRLLAFSFNDGSQIELAPGSELRYADTFITSRDFYLKGEAVFHVAKDPVKPFTVYAGRVATTALGTVFKVIAQPAATRVRLLSGKVMVEPDSLLKTRGVKTAYLAPGQELNLDVEKAIATVITPHNQAMPDTVNVILTFNNEPLENIFNTLSERYHQKITFREGLLTGMSFTGEFNGGKESLNSFIETTCTLNNLTIHRKNKEIYITGQ